MEQFVGSCMIPIALITMISDCKDAFSSYFDRFLLFKPLCAHLSSCSPENTRGLTLNGGGCPLTHTSRSAPQCKSSRPRISTSPVLALILVFRETGLLPGTTALA